MTLLGVVDNLIHRIESHHHDNLNEADQGIPVPVERASSGNPDLEELNDDLAKLENLDYTLKHGFSGVEGDIKILVDRWKDRMVCPSLFYPLSVSTSSPHFFT